MAKKILSEKTVKLDDMQGMLAWGYGKLPFACFVLMAYGANADMRGWLFEFKSNITPASARPKDVAINLAFTHAGLRAFDLDEATLSSFSQELIDGMTTPHRQRILGDEGVNAPDHWEWGGAKTPVIHAVLFIYARTSALLEAEYDKAVASFNAHDLNVIKRLDTAEMAQQEHFGFRDGISQPAVQGLPQPKKSGDPLDAVPAGEFFMGYKNAYDQDPDSPRVTPADGKRMPKYKTRGNSDAGVDLGRNGSYLVFRQLEQDVPKFWHFMLAQAESNEGAIRLASKMVGRWPSGTPLVKSPEQDNPPQTETEANDFKYAAEDPDGLACPFGAHIRRTNPRDALEGTEIKLAAKIVNRHRILRRGRNYGPPLVASLNPHDMLAALQAGVALPEEKRGLMFICLNANIQRQFEFVQHTWCNNPKFETLYDEVDAISGAATHSGDNHFSMPAQPVRQRVSGVPRFVQVRGGAYFFMPGLETLQYLANKRL